MSDCCSVLDQHEHGHIEGTAGAIVGQVAISSVSVLGAVVGGFAGVISGAIWREGEWPCSSVKRNGPANLYFCVYGQQLR